MRYHPRVLDRQVYKLFPSVNQKKVLVNPVSKSFSPSYFNGARDRHQLHYGKEAYNHLA